MCVGVNQTTVFFYSHERRCILGLNRFRQGHVNLRLVTRSRTVFYLVG